MKLNKKNKILIGTGSVVAIASIATPLAIVFTKDSDTDNVIHRKNNVLHPIHKSNPIQKPEVSLPLPTQSTTKPTFIEPHETVITVPKAKPKPVKKPIIDSIQYKNDEVRTQFLELLRNPLISIAAGSNATFKSILSSENKINSLTSVASQLFKSGLTNIDFNNVDVLLNTFGVSSKVVNIIKTVLLDKNGKVDYKTLDLIFNQGLAKMVTKSKPYSILPEYKDVVAKFMNLIKTFVPSSVLDLVPLKYFEKIIFTGISKNEFKQLFNKIVDSKFSSFMASIVEGGAETDVETIYDLLPILKTGIVKAGFEWQQSLYNLQKVLDHKILHEISIGSLLGNLISDNDGKQKDWQLLPLVKRIISQVHELADKGSNQSERKSRKWGKSHITTLVAGIYAFINNGLSYKWFHPEQKQQISNLIEWILNLKQGDLYKADFDKYKTSIKDLFKDLRDVDNNVLDLSSIDKAKTIGDIKKAAKSIVAYKQHKPISNGKRATDVSAQSIYDQLGNWRIAAEDISKKAPGLIITIDRILNNDGDYYDENSHKFEYNWGSSHFTEYGSTEMNKIATDFKNSIDNKDRSSAFKWWDKIIDEANKIKVYDRAYKGNRKLVKINWFNEFKQQTKHGSAPYKDYNKELFPQLVDLIAKKGYYLSNDKNKNDIVSKSYLESYLNDARNTFKIQPLLDKINSLIKNGLYVDKDIIHKVNLNSQIDKLWSKNVNSYHFHQRKPITIENYKDIVKNELKKLRTKKDVNDAEATLNLDLKPLDDKKIEGVQQFYNVAKNILESTTNGLWDEKGAKQDISKIESTTLKIPAIDYGKKLNLSVLTGDVSKNGTESKMTYFVLSNIEVISNFLLNGYPTVENDQKEFDKVFKNILKMALESFGLKNGADSILNLAQMYLGPIFDSVKKYHKDEANNKVSLKKDENKIKKATA